MLLAHITKAIHFKTGVEYSHEGLLMTFTNNTGDMAVLVYLSIVRSNKRLSAAEQQVFKCRCITRIPGGRL